VGAAARLQIGRLDLDGAQNALAFHFLSNAELRQLVRGAIANVHGTVFENNLVGCPFGAFEEFLGRLRAAQINGANLLAKMVGNRGQSETLLKHGGEQMLSGVLLHVVEAAGQLIQPFTSGYPGGGRQHE